MDEQTSPLSVGASASPEASESLKRRSAQSRYLGAGLLASLLVVAFAAYAVVRASTATPTPQTFPSASPSVIPAGHAAPLFSLPPLNGDTPVALRALMRRPVVVNFFASWCTDCRAELGALSAVSHAYHSAVQFVGIDSSDTDLALSRQLLQRVGVTYPVGVDSQGTLASAYSISALPVTIFLDTAGRVVGELYGKQSVTTLDRGVRGLLTYPTSP